MKPNVIVALIVGLLIGFAAGQMLKSNGPSAGGPGPVAGAPSPSPSPSPAAPAGARPQDQTTFKVPVEGSPVLGSSSALVTLVEISDYECPFCKRGHTTVEQLRKDYGDKLRVVMKQNPLPFHQNARPAALAALAAGKQGKYWEMHNKMFDGGGLDGASLERYATEIGLNVEKWKADLLSPELAKVIQDDQALAQSLGATGTPAFFINGRKLSGAQPLPNFKSIVDEELAKAQAMVNGGVPADQVYAKVMEKGVTSPPPAAPAPQAPAAPAGAPAAGAVKRIEVPADSPSFGPKFAKVTIVEWSDFQCPFCSRVSPTLAKIKENYAKDVKVVFRHQPLPFHGDAQLAAEASMAAHEQGKFWEFHDKMFANQGALKRPDLERYAKEIGLNDAKFKAALDSGKFTQRVKQDAQAGSAVGANGTPTFFINGQELVGAQPFESFKPIIDREIANADKLIAAGVKLENVYEKILSQEPPPPPPVAVGDAPLKGPKNAPVTIVTWSDFQCPFCSRVVPTLKQIEDEYGNKVAIAFKHQPLPFHNNARIAAAASMAANEQGKFWEMHDKMFANQNALDRPSLERYAQELGLNMPKFKSVLDTNKYDAYITKDSQDGSARGANGTPTFFINGRQLVGAQPVDAFKAIIEEELKKAKK